MNRRLTFIVFAILVIGVMTSIPVRPVATFFVGCDGRNCKYATRFASISIFLISCFGSSYVAIQDYKTSRVESVTGYRFWSCFESTTGPLTVVPLTNVSEVSLSSKGILRMEIMNVGGVPITRIECTISPDIRCPPISLQDTLYPGEKLVIEGPTGEAVFTKGRAYTVILSLSTLNFENTPTLHGMEIRGVVSA